MGTYSLKVAHSIPFNGFAYCIGIFFRDPMDPGWILSTKFVECRWIQSWISQIVSLRDLRWVAILRICAWVASGCADE